MNVFVEELAKAQIKRGNGGSGYTVVIEDNVGECIHIHIWQLRIDLTVRDFQTFAENVIQAKELLSHGHHD